MEKGEGTAGRKEDKVVFHFCSGGVCPPQTITMLLHYHGNSSIGARDSKESGFVPLGSLAAFCCLCSSSAGDEERTEDFWGVELKPASPLVDFIASKQKRSHPLIPRCHVVISHINMFRRQFST